MPKGGNPLAQQSALGWTQTERGSRMGSTSRDRIAVAAQLRDQSQGTSVRGRGGVRRYGNYK